MKKILVVGSLNMDMVVNVDHAPATGETILADRMELIPGGKWANQTYAAGRLGADVSILGAVGCDSYGEILLKNLREANVDVSHVIRKEEATGVALITVNGEGDNSIVVVSGANRTLSCDDIDENMELIRSADMVLLQMEIPVETVCYTAKAAKAMGKTVILDPAPVPKHFPEELYQYIDIIKPNETELAMLTGIRDIDSNIGKAAACIRGRGVRNVLVTLGEKGVYLDSQETGIVRIPARKVCAIDTTAGGDAFTAAVAFQLAQGKDIREAAAFANHVSSIVVTRKGAQSSIPTLAEVEESLGHCSESPV